MVDLPRTPSFGLHGKRALISGAGRGIGAGTASALAEAGASVVLVSRTIGEVEEVAKAIRERGGMATAVALDVCDTDAVTRKIGELGRFEILVNNAGTNRPKSMQTVGLDDYSAVMDLNVKATYFLSQAVVSGMLAAGAGGSIVNVSSQMGHVGAANRTLYCASKFAIEGLTKSMAVELAPHGIRVNSIGPTFIETPMTQGFLSDPAFRHDVLRKIKLGRLARVEDVLGGIVYLASDAAAMVTGTSLLIDGGWTAE